MNIETVIVDDDPYVLATLNEMLQTIPGVKVEGLFKHPQQAVGYLKIHRPDLIFLDIQMPGMSGFELLNELGDQVPEIIFVTAYNEYAITAIRYSALDYLLKPVSISHLQESISRFKLKTERLLSQARLASLRHNLSAAQSQEFDLILTSKSEGELRFKAKEIVRCEADSNYTHIMLSNGRKFLASKTLSDLESLLSPDTFIRIHKSHLINTSHVKGLSKQHEVSMSDNSLLPISKRRYQTVRQLLPLRDND